LVLLTDVTILSKTQGYNLHSVLDKMKKLLVMQLKQNCPHYNYEIN